MTKDSSILKLKNVSKFYYNKGVVASGFSKVSLEFNLGEFVVITGESGSGKSTLLNVLSGLDSYEEGEMFINGEETSHYNESDFENYRKTYIGNIFQSFNLVGSYTVYQNIELVLLLNGYKKHNIHKKIIELIKKVDLYKYRNTKTSKLSGGQKQRVAIARALAKDTPIIIADEPTGNLDSKSAKSVIKILSEIATDKLVIIVTHNYDQVESYATRKIEMHDGKIREDINLKEYTRKEPTIYEYKNISFFNKICLGIRNTFNIFSKFILTFLVFFFVISAFLGEYSGFRSAEYEESLLGYNAFFNASNEKRIIIKKKDKTEINNNDLKKLSNIEHISSIEKDDVLIDSYFNVYNNKYFFYGSSMESYKNISKVDEGRLPENDYEVVIKGSSEDYYLSFDVDDLFNQDLKLYNDYDNEILIEKPLKVVGIIYNDNNFDYSTTIYVSDKINDFLRLTVNELYSDLYIKLNDNTFRVYKGQIFMKLSPSKNVKEGEAVIPSGMSNYCEYGNCINKDFEINIKNIYYEENKTLKITNIYNKNNYTFLIGDKNYDDHNGIIYISEKDYNDLYNRYTYQSSVYVDDVKNLEGLLNILNEKGYDALSVKSVITRDGLEVLAFLKIFKVVITVILCVILFFICYFVIRLIQKSKNVYYSTVRILGASKKVIKNLISIELLTVFNIAYLLFMALTYLVKNNIIKSNYISGLTKFLTVKDYVIIYIILVLMSYILSLRYSHKLFKSSAMKTYNEEV